MQIVFRSVLVGFLVLSSISLYAQNTIDSLEVQLGLAPEEDKLDIMFRLSLAYAGSKPEKALQMGQEAFAKASGQENPPAQIKALLNLALLNKNLLSEYDVALDLSFQALKKAEELNNGLLKAETFSLIASIYFESGNPFKALDFYMQAIPILKESGQPGELAKAIMTAGTVHLELENYPKAIEYYKEAEDLARKISDTDIISQSIFLTGQVYLKQNLLDLALEKHLQALKIRQEFGAAASITESQNALGEIYRLKGDYKLAMAAHRIAINKIKGKDHSSLLSQAYNQLSATLIVQKLHSTAIPVLDSALYFAQSVNDKKAMKNSYEMLYDCYVSRRDYNRALRYKDLYTGISEFINNEENARKMAELQAGFDIERKESEIEVLKRDREIQDLTIEKQRNLSYFLILGLLLLVVIALLILYLYKLKQRSNRQLSEINIKVQKTNDQLTDLNATKDRFFSIIAHDIKGPLHSLRSFSDLLINHTDKMSKEEIQFLAKDIDQSLKNLFGLLENLLEWARSQTGRMDLRIETFDLSQVVKNNLNLLGPSALAKQITLKFSLPDNLMVTADANTTSTVIRNLLSNAIKFTPQNGEVVIRVNEWKDAVEVSIKDSGVGIPKSVQEKLFRLDHKQSTKGTAGEKGTGLGLILCKEFVEKNGGWIAVTSEEGKGSDFHFSIPKPKD